MLPLLSSNFTEIFHSKRDCIGCISYNLENVERVHRPTTILFLTVIIKCTECPKQTHNINRDGRTRAIVFSSQLNERKVEISIMLCTDEC